MAILDVHGINLSMNICDASGVAGWENWCILVNVNDVVKIWDNLICISTSGNILSTGDDKSLDPVRNFADVRTIKIEIYECAI